MTRRGRRGALVLLVLSWAPAPGQGPPPTAATPVRFDGGERLDATLPGPVLDRVAARVGDRERSLILLLADLDGSEAAAARDPCSGPAGRRTTLWEWRLSATAGPVRLASDPPPEGTRGLHVADLDGDATDELLLLSDRVVEVRRREGGRWVRAGAPLPVAPAGDDARTAALPLVIGRERPWLLLGALGSVRFLRASGTGSSWETLAEVELPVRASVTPGAIRAVSPTPLAVGPGPDGPWSFATPVEVHGTRRLRTARVDPAADAPAGTAVECWAGLPVGERPIQWWLLSVDGEPRLLALSTRADKLSLLGEKRLRLFSLHPDRSRTGHPPLFSVETRINLWQPTFAFVEDIDEDGRDDLVLGYWKGLLDSRVALDAYVQRDDGTWHDEPRTSAFDVKRGRRDYLGYSDVDGDGRHDLLVLGDGRLRVHRGAPASSRRVVDKKPLLVAPLGDDGVEAAVEVRVGAEGAGTRLDPLPGLPWPADLDGDGRREIVLHRALALAEGGRPATLVSIVRWR